VQLNILQHWETVAAEKIGDLVELRDQQTGVQGEMAKTDEGA